MGGNLAYEYVMQVNDSTFRYKIIFKTYTNCGVNSNIPFPEASVTLGIYRDTVTANLPLQTLMTINLTDTTLIEPALPNSCTVGSGVCIIEGIYIDEIDLPKNYFGYHLYYNRCCRNGDILNLDNPGGRGMVFHAYIPPTLVENSSPVFSDLPMPFLCIDDTSSILNTAFDPDGDQLLFAFVDPYEDGPYPPFQPNPPATISWPLPTVPWLNITYNKNFPFGPNGYAYINGATGYSEYMSPDTGKFVVAVEIKEYRNNQLIGISRRDMQLLLLDCPFNPPPSLSNISGSGQTSYTIEEGDSLCFPITFSDEFGDSLTMVVVSPIFDTSVTNPAATVTTPVVGDSVVTSDFCWNTACDQGQGLPYIFTVSVQDNGCPPKTKDVVYEISVTDFVGPTTITGVTSVCPFATGLTYSVPSHPGATYSWTITGGTQVAGGTTNSITVDWDGPGIGIVALITTSSLGCPDGPININVTINDYPAADAGLDVFFCSRDTAQLGVPATLNYIYSWAPTTGLGDPLAPDPTITLLNSFSTPDTFQYIVTTTNILTFCVQTDTVLAIVYPLPVADAGTDVNFCSGDTIGIGSTAIVGYTYSWTPGTGLSDSTLSDPTITLTNFGLVPDTFTYIVTATDTAPACVESDTIRVIVSPYPIPNAGPDLAFCSGLSDTLGAPLTAGYTYLWSPVTGLSDSSLSDPIITLTNADTITDSLDYIVETSVFGCTDYDTAEVLVYASPIVDAGPDKYLCSGDVDTIGSATISGYTYLWNPTTGLSDSSLSNPEITLTNLLLPNDTTYYVVSVTTGFACNDEDTVRVIVNHLPISDAGNDTSFCSGDTVALGVATVAGYNYGWNPGTGLSDSAVSNPSISLINADTIIDTLMYYVTTTVDSCSTMDSVQVIVYPLPIVDAGPDRYICSGDADTIGSDGLGGYSYLWTPGTGLSDSTISNPVVTLTNPSIPNDTNIYIVSVTTSFSCIDRDTVLVIVNYLPTAEAGADVSFCSGDSDTLGTAVTLGYTYLWNPATGLSDSTASNPEVSLLNADTISDTTMYYVMTTVDSCSTMDSVQVIVFPLPISDAGVDVALCSGDTVPIGSAAKTNLIYSWSPDTGLSDTAISNPTVSLLNPDSIVDTLFYVVVTTDTITSCVSSDTVRVIVYNVPVTPEIFGSISVCPGVDSVSYWVEGDAGSTFSWSLVGNGTIIFGQGTDSILIDWDTTILWTITVIETDSNGCPGDSSTMDGKTNVLLEPVIPEGPDSLCNDSLTGIEYQVLFTNGSVYAWSISGGTITAGNGSNMVTVDWDSTGFIWYDETSTTIDTVCTGTSDTLFVSIFDVPTASSISGNMAVCESLTPETYSIAGLSGSTFTWFVDGDTIANGIGVDTVSYVWDTAGVYEISVIETAIGNCSQTLIDTVTVYQKPTAANIFGDTAICFNIADTFLYYVTGFSGSTYQWSVLGGTITSTPLNNDSISIRWDSVVSGLLTVVETSSDACVGDTIWRSVEVFQVPQETAINGVFEFCEDSVQNMYWVGSLPGSMVTWLLDGDTITSGIDADTINLTWDTAGTYLITVVEVTVNACSNTLMDTVTVFQKPQTSSISGDTAICFDSISTYLYHVLGFSGSTYDWVVVNGQIVSTPMNNDSITVSWDSLGAGLITVVETSQDSCVGDTATLNIQINEIPTADSIVGDFEECRNALGFSYTLNGFGGSTYLWSVPGASNIIDDSSNTITADWDTAGTFLISVVEVSAAGCVGDTVDTTIIIFPHPQTVTMAGDTNICPPNNLAQLYSVVGFDSSTYIWTVTGGVIDTGQGTSSILVNWDTVGTGVVTVVEITKDSCWGDTIGWANIILDSPGIMIEVVTDGEFDDAVIEIKWSMINSIGFPDSISILRRLHFSNNPWTTLIKLPALTQIYIDGAVITDAYSYEYQITGLNACLDAVSSDVHNSILLEGSKKESDNTIDLVWNKYIGWKQGVQRYEVWRKLDDESSYSFYADAGLDTSISFESGVDGFVHCFRVLAFEDFGNQEISWSNELCLEFEHLLVIPNVITPNGNGWNDTWHIENIEYYPRCIVEIYNRWGMKLFTSVGYPVEWDGTYHGKDLPVGVYYYVIDIIVEGVEPYTGSVSILHRGK